MDGERKIDSKIKHTYGALIASNGNMGAFCLAAYV